MMKSNQRRISSSYQYSLTLSLLASFVRANLDWNLESTFLQHLQQKEQQLNNETENQIETSIANELQASHIYPTWVSEGTCSTKCVDIRGEEEFCVATSTCEHSTWRRAFDKHQSQLLEADLEHEQLIDYDLAMSMSHCEVWGDLNRCDGALCDIDHECQSGCCGNFISFTHRRCLPILGNYCAGRDTSRHSHDHYSSIHRPHHHENSIHDQLDSHLSKDLHMRVSGEEKHDEELQKEALAKQAKDRMADGSSSKTEASSKTEGLQDIIEELVQLQVLAQQEHTNEEEPAAVNGLRGLASCLEHGHNDLCDDLICEFDGQCRSGCCSQVLTQDYNRCAAMLVGDYCPRALDPILTMIQAQKEVELEAAHALDLIEQAEAKTSEDEDKKILAQPTTELPCNVFGTVDRCDGMACEHDGNCFSGCCSLFVSGDQKRCMPLVGGDLCPIAIDVVEQFKIVDQEALEEMQHHEEELLMEVNHEKDHDEIYHEEIDHVDFNEDHPIIEKGEHHDAEDVDLMRHTEYDDDYHFDDDDIYEADHIIPEKREHHFIQQEEDLLQDLEEEYVDADHYIPEKSEHYDPDVHHMSKDRWTPAFHGPEEEEFYEDANIDEEPFTNGKLTPIQPNKDDPRLNIPKGPTTPMHDHPIVSKDTQITPEQKASYGQAYEHGRKEALYGDTKESVGLAPKLPTGERKMPITHREQTERASQAKRQPCSAYGNKNRCERMSCEEDDQCASQCCGQTTNGGSLQCHTLIAGSFCPRALAPKVDYSTFAEQDDYSRRNDILRTNPSNEIPNYRGQDGCKVHGNEDQCDGHACVTDVDCHSGCCGHFVSFSLRRCLPLTNDGMCPRFLEPSFTSPIPARLPPIESTIKDMYSIQNRVHHLQEILDPISLPIHQDVLFCRSYGSEKLCDGFLCSKGSNCQSGCCASFGKLNSDYCQPLIEGVCPVPGFTYGPQGDIHEKLETIEEEFEVPEPIEDLQSIIEPQPPQFNEDGTGEKPPTEQKKENAFWNGVGVGVAIWVAVIIVISGIYYCYKKNSAVTASNSMNVSSQYQNLPSSSQQFA